MAGAAAGRFEKDYFTSQESLRYYYQDHLGSRVGVVNESGAVLATMTYDIWENATTSGVAGYDAEREIRFTGKPMDAACAIAHTTIFPIGKRCAAAYATGLYYFNARYYDPRASGS